jgi:hypothetical protein
MEKMTVKQIIICMAALANDIPLAVALRYIKETKQ